MDARRCAQVIMRMMETLHIGKGSKPKTRKPTQTNPKTQQNLKKDQYQRTPTTNVGRVSHCTKVRHLKR